ncbi:MAG: hypothetical protein HY012_03190 [Acidobacteria bacterium]|nr:hypothetical protein [Acidobacteriota bacterium]
MRVAILTVSDSVFRGERADLSGPALRERCMQLGWQVVAAEIVSDDSPTIEAFLIACADSQQADIILTTGGTGLGPRDVTPEATAAVCARLIPRCRRAAAPRRRSPSRRPPRLIVFLELSEI